jgi:DNA mismatch repair protein MutS
MSKNETSLYLEYFKFHDDYEKEYGKDRIIIFMEVGKFYEIYACDEHGCDYTYISKELELRLSVRDKDKQKKISKHNPWTMGCPSNAVRKYVEKLLSLNYYVVMIDQFENTSIKSKKMLHKEVNIYTPSTYINDDITQHDNNFIVSINVLEEKQLDGELLACCGLSALDLSTGEVYYYETYSTKNDKMYAFDEIYRFIKHFNPTETLLLINKGISNNIGDFNNESLISWLDINKDSVCNISKDSLKERCKLKYQNEVLKKVYNHMNILNPIDYFNLDRLEYCKLALINMFDYVWKHNQDIVHHLKEPIQFDNNKYLYLGNNALSQLDIINKYDKTSNKSKISSLFDVINHTSTIMGKRFLKNSLLNPIINKKKLNTRYSDIEKLNNYVKIDELLKNIYDITKLQRKISLNILHPFELFNLCLSYTSIKDIHNIIVDYKLKSIKKFDISFIDKFMTEISNIFDLQKMSQLKLTDINESFFVKNYNTEIDDLQEKLNNHKNIFDDVAKYFDKIIKKSGTNKYIELKKDTTSTIKVMYNEREGHYLLLTKIRSNILKKYLEENKTVKFGDISINASDIQFKDLISGKQVKLMCNKISHISSQIVDVESQLSNKIKEVYKNVLKDLYNKYSESFINMENYVAIVDFLVNGAKIAKMNNYVKPEIIKSDKSFFIAEKMRHPIVEHINVDTEYVPHNVSLGINEISSDSINGILLYGINSAGKSTLMKSIGINIVLAQIGYYTATESFKFSPYHSLFTRINGNDNIMRGLSSFMVEVIELRAILKRNNKNSLIISDEICRGTEVKSANIIVVYMIEEMVNKGASFITATHLHQLTDFPTIQKLQNIKLYHIGVEYNKTEHLLIYDRELKEGQGESFYGLKTAQFIMKDDTFNKRTSDIEHELEQITDIIQPTTSKYNTSLYMDKCEICNTQSELETHHINWQKDCTDGFIDKKSHVKMNHKSNLMSICKKCHDDVDRTKIIIHGRVNTSNGLLLSWDYNNDVKKQNKYNDAEINTILNYKSKYDKKQAKIILKEKHNLKISTSHIQTLWSNK